VWGAVVKNYSHHATRRFQLNIGIAYEGDIDQALAVIEDLIEKDERALSEPAPLVAVDELGESSVDLIIRVWAASGDLWDLRRDLTKAIKQRFDAEGISIPYPQRVVHMVEAPAA
jgi:small conductance mechanosensitive channel